MRPMTGASARRMLAILATSVCATALPLAAQRIDRAPARGGALGAQQQPGLERLFQERLAEVVRRRLNLNESQMRQLGQVNSRFERERMVLFRDERRARQALRAEVLAGDSANQSKVANLLDQLFRIQRQRLDLTEREQQELSAFMTPTQRAMYFGIQDDLRRRMEEVRQQRQQRRAGARGLGQRQPPP